MRTHRDRLNRAIDLLLLEEPTDENLQEREEAAAFLKKFLGAMIQETEDEKVARALRICLMSELNLDHGKEIRKIVSAELINRMIRGGLIVNRFGSYFITAKGEEELKQWENQR